MLSVFRELFLLPMYSNLFPTFLTITFSVSGFVLKALIHLDFLYRMIDIDLVAFLYMLTSTQIHCIICRRCFLLCMSDFFIKTKISIGVQIYTDLPFNSIGYLVGSMPILCYFYHAMAIQYSMNQIVITPEFLLLYMIVLALLGFFCFFVKIKYFSFNICKEVCWKFDGYYIKLC